MAHNPYRDAVNDGSPPDEYRYDSATGLFINDTNLSGMMDPATAVHSFRSVAVICLSDGKENAVITDGGVNANQRMIN